MARNANLMVYCKNHNGDDSDTVIHALLEFPGIVSARRAANGNRLVLVDYDGERLRSSEIAQRLSDRGLPIALVGL